MRPEFEDKICDPADLPGRLASMPRPLVFTNGVFDILHRGHVTYLAEARAKGRSLIVALNSDASAKRLGKGDDRPINTLGDRRAVIAALESVDLVTWFDEDTPIRLIGICSPDVLVKGGDWKEDKIVGAAEVMARGGSVHSIPFEWATSTSALVERIRRQKPCTPPTRPSPASPPRSAATSSA
jgi:D-glycero-beta-D-manno-heptose 1-phosphate adenylyltransferase